MVLDHDTGAGPLHFKNLLRRRRLGIELEEGSLWVKPLYSQGEAIDAALLLG